MTRTTPDRVDSGDLAALVQLLAAGALSLDMLCARSSAVVLFGSRSCREARANSDWDIFVISDRDAPSLRITAIDLVWVPCTRAGISQAQQWPDSGCSRTEAATPPTWRSPAPDSRAEPSGW